MKLMSERKRKDEKKKFYSSKIVNGTVWMLILIFCFMSVNVFADDALASAKGLLSKGAIAGGGLWAVWGLVTLGMAIKDHNGPGIQGAIWQLIGGGIIIAAGGLVGSLDISMAA